MMIIAFLAALATPAPQCPPVKVAAEKADMPASFGADSVERVSALFQQAYESACAKGLVGKKPLISAEGKNPGQLFLFNAANSNVATIYTREDGRTVLEYYFVTEDGKTNIPPAEEIDEAIYCATVGATQAEQEESGRCLPD